MGMAASQARLLSLTARLTDLEYSAQRISNSRVELATNSEEVSQKYADALDAKKLTIRTGFSNGNEVYQDMSYSLLTGPSTVLNAQYGLSDSLGRLLVTKDMESKFKASATLEDFLAANGANVSVTGFPAGKTQADYQSDIAAQSAAQADYNIASGDTKTKKALLDSIGQQSVQDYGVNIQNGDKVIPFDYATPNFNANATPAQITQYANAYEHWDTAKTTEAEKLATLTGAKKALEGYTFTSADDGSYYTNIYNRMQQGFVSMEDEKSTIKDPEWIYNQMNSGNLHLEGADKKTGEWKTSSWQTNTDLIEKDDDQGLAIIKAKFDVQIEKIQNADKELELDLKRIDTEHSALQTEAETIVKVINKNIERSFKTFG